MWLFIGASATLALTATYHLRGALPVAPTIALNAIAFYVMFTVMHDSVHRTAHRSRFLDTRIYPSRFLNAVLLGQNYHLIHHLWTTIPWYRYQRVFRAIRPELEARGSRVGWTVEPLAVDDGSREPATR